MSQLTICPIMGVRTCSLSWPCIELICMVECVYVFVWLIGQHKWYHYENNECLLAVQMSGSHSKEMCIVLVSVFALCNGNVVEMINMRV